MEAGVKSVGAWWAGVAAAAVLAGCGNNSDLPYPDQIEKVPGTDNQTVAAPTLASVAPSQFSGGDVVTVQGTGLSGSALFEVNGAPATVTSGTATTLSVEIPICLAPGQVTLRARVAGALTNVITGTYIA